MHRALYYSSAANKTDQGTSISWSENQSSELVVTQPGLFLSPLEMRVGLTCTPVPLSELCVEYCGVHATERILYLDSDWPSLRLPFLHHLEKQRRNSNERQTLEFTSLNQTLSWSENQSSELHVTQLGLFLSPGEMRVRSIRTPVPRSELCVWSVVASCLPGFWLAISTSSFPAASRKTEKELKREANIGV